MTNTIQRAVSVKYNTEGSICQIQYTGQYLSNTIQRAVSVKYNTQGSICQIQYRAQYLSNIIQRNVAKAIPIRAHNEFNADFKVSRVKARKLHAHVCLR